MTVFKEIPPDLDPEATAAEQPSALHLSFPSVRVPSLLLPGRVYNSHFTHYTLMQRNLLYSHFGKKRQDFCDVRLSHRLACVFTLFAALLFIILFLFFSIEVAELEAHLPSEYAFHFHAHRYV